MAKAGNAAFSSATRSMGMGKKAPRIKKPSTDRTTVSFKGRQLPVHVVPYARANKRSQTIGFNAGGKVPRTHKRLVGGAYLRIETTTRHTTADKIAGKAVSKVLPSGTRRGRAAGAFKRNFSINNPALRGTRGNVQGRLSTSRGAGPTLVIRRGRHKVSQSKSATGIQKYDTRMKAIAGAKAAKKKPRPSRRKAARKRR